MFTFLMNLPSNLSYLNKVYVLYLVLLIAILTIYFIPPISQNPDYHDFADQRKIFGIAHFWNVFSNLPFLIVSFIAVNDLLKDGVLKYPATLFLCYLIFFIAIGAVCLGSAYYHLQPSNNSLFWDRLPMTVGFMAFTAIIIGEFINEEAALKMLLPLILLGMASVVYWSVSELAGNGDLRFYVLIQFGPILIIPMIILMFPARYSHTGYLWAMLGAYFIAKVFELLDAEVYQSIGFSGHAIKHLFAATGPYLFYLALKKRCRFI